MRQLTPAPNLPLAEVSRVIEMAWEDRTSFEAIQIQFGLNEAAVVELMRRHLKRSSFKMWRQRVAGRVTKHGALRDAAMNGGSKHVARGRRSPAEGKARR
jgi:uncharacterized protein (TIGR03643 family)